jgi:hypothetical protein
VRRQAVPSDRQRVERRFKAAQDESELRYGNARASLANRVKEGSRNVLPTSDYPTR